MVSVIEGFYCTYIQGWIQRLKKGGHRGEIGGREYSMHSTLGGPGDMLPQRLYESASEAIQDHHNHTKFVASGVYLRRLIAW